METITPAYKTIDGRIFEIKSDAESHENFIVTSYKRKQIKQIIDEECVRLASDSKLETHPTRMSLYYELMPIAIINCIDKINEINKTTLTDLIK